MSASMRFPVKALIEALAKSKDEEINEFSDWLKQQVEESGYSDPSIVALSIDSPDLVGYQWYEAEYLEEDGLDVERRRNYRQHGGSAVEFEFGAIVDYANDFMDEDEQFVAPV